ncbi:hypothetical protein CORC01_13280 [Colletotrichum orchidophilum]|uniref:Uncharacterized protein n=1 Tax=Colletotrichum orchidophilum TaxID=1209926 RepID=A0A1G4AQN4_9PEZI|nr:uncharacterized protein CORC01_13280 [Colletotrichum orchidophilum]OHE91415.1 hypothetical protein CORC01_13280 [Colletotrichum orchidophilum]
MPIPTYSTIGHTCYGWDNDTKSKGIGTDNALIAHSTSVIFMVRGNGETTHMNGQLQEPMNVTDINATFANGRKHAL